MDCFNNKKIIVSKKSPKVIKVWIILLFVFSIVLMFIININYEKKTAYNFVYDEYLSSYLKDDDIDNFGEKIILNGVKYDFKIVRISEEYYLNEYRKVDIAIDKKFVENEKVKVYSFRDTSIYKNLKMKVEDSLWN